MACWLSNSLLVEQRRVLRPGRRQWLGWPLGIERVLPAGDADAFILAGWASSDEAVVLGLRHPEQALTRFTSGSPAAFNKRQPGFAGFEGTAVFNETGDAQDPRPKRRRGRFIVVVEPVANIYREVHEGALAQPRAVARAE